MPSSKNTIVGLLLAAGKSTRFGSNKLLHTLPDTKKILAVQSVENLLATIPDCYAIVHPDDFALKKILSKTGINIIENYQAAQGLSSSIRCGIEHTPDAAGWVIALADMPFVPVSVIEQVVSALNQGALLAAPAYKSQRGHPVGFARTLKQELLEIQGDSGARSIIIKYLSDIQFIQSDHPGILYDIDVPADLEPGPIDQQVQDI